ncbi:sugar phosphate isomerase/epimerase [Caballeronia sp. LZ008]|uniref:sugar phosphate isomerase/epimerase family protein n=1 Tax=unclassified Caballeronia TaxID=2646786 RepID=UPI0020276CE5|nr:MULTISPECIES: sugar phosphate isomerase/epimerase [unclassified Caballeronia]MDR5798178.1 sugar phosphate isomerase/epimerase [Caballeronia sp. LZ008]
MLSLSPLTLLPCSPLELIDVALDAGFDAVGLRLFPVMPTDVDVLADRGLQKAIQQRLSTSGLQVLDVEVVRISPNTDIAGLQPSLEFAAGVGARTFAVTAPLRGDYKPEDEGPTARKLRELCELASRYGIKPTIEFMIFRGVGTLEEAVRLVNLVDHPNLGICVDALHLQRSGGTPESLGAIDKSLLSCFQICDAPAEAPQDVQKEARFGRLYPGEGALPLAQMLDVLPSEIPVAVEAPAVAHAGDSLKARAHDVARRTRAILASRAH